MSEANFPDDRAPRRAPFPKLERFEVRRPLGKGGMGLVYEAVDRETGAVVALKMLHRDGSEAILDLKSEFRELQELRHPNLVEVRELFEEGGRWFLTMELVPGTDLVSYVRPGGTLDEGRLRSAFAQLGQGLTALHATGRVHRDIKPANVLVTPEGRTVLVDFGLVTVAEGDQGERGLVGTALHMSPEQAALLPAGTEADCYGVGVMLYEALTGRLPFEGNARTVMIDKQHREPVPPREHAIDTPADLDALCTELLRIRPELRPTAKELAERIERRTSSGEVARHVQTTNVVHFFGRAAELTKLREAFDAADTRAVFVVGESGVGKSALVRRFATTLSPATLTLFGRCYERESLPFKAVDGIVDALSLALAKLPRAALAPLLPPHAGLLGQVFPVMRRLDPIADAPPVGKNIDPAELRSRLFMALRELLARLATTRRVVLCVDDLQWADSDSFGLLDAVLRPPDAPGVMLVATMRSKLTGGETQGGTGLGVLGGAFGQAFKLPMPINVVELRAFEGVEATEFALGLLAREGEFGSEQAERIAREAKGHPLFVQELARHVHSGAIAQAGLRLDEALLERISRLPAQAQRLLELSALAGVPLSLDVLQKASALSPNELARAVSALRVERLLSTRGVRLDDVVEPYHDRVREAVAACLSGDVGRAHHRALARALEVTKSSDAELSLTQWRGAGEPARAAAYALRAAKNAETAFAFAHASRLYRLALELDPACRLDDGGGVRARLAEALFNAGLGESAGDTFLEAVGDTSGGDARELRLRAAAAYFRSGFYDKATRAIEPLMAEHGLTIPTGWARVLLAYLWIRFLLALRGLRFRPRAREEVAPSTLTQHRLYRVLGDALGAVDPIVGATLHGRGLLLALRRGATEDVFDALCGETLLESVAGTPRKRRVEQLLATTRAALPREQSPRAKARMMMAEGASAFYRGAFRETLRIFADFEEQLRGVPGLDWERAVMWQFRVWCLYYIGDPSELERAVSRDLREAIERGDRYARVVLRTGPASFAWLLRDDPAGALREASEALSEWSRNVFDTCAWLAWCSEANALLYTPARSADAYAVLLESWPRMRRSILFRTCQMVRIEAHDLRARTALAAPLRARAEARLVADAERSVRAIEREKSAVGDAMARLLRASIAHARGDIGRATMHSKQAVDAFDAADMALHAACARTRLAELTGDDALAAEARRYFERERVRNPPRMVATLAPGFSRGAT